MRCIGRVGDVKWFGAVLRFKCHWLVSGGSALTNYKSAFYGILVFYGILCQDSMLPMTETDI